jgi:hypothetical protein
MLIHHIEPKENVKKLTLGQKKALANKFSTIIYSSYMKDGSVIFTIVWHNQSTWRRWLLEGKSIVDMWSLRTRYDVTNQTNGRWTELWDVFISFIKENYASEELMRKTEQRYSGIPQESEGF